MSEPLSMREASRVLDVSPIRVRELIRKGKLEAEKVSDEHGERWQISEGSVSAYLATRERDEDTGAAAPAGPVPDESLTNLVRELEGQLDRVRDLIQEIERVQSYVDGLRRAQRSLSTELAGLRQRLDEEAPAQTEAAGEEAAADEAPTEAEPPAEEPPAEEPPAEEPAAKKKAAKKKTASKKKASAKKKTTTTSKKKASKKKSSKKKTPKTDKT